MDIAKISNPQLIKQFGALRVQEKELLVEVLQHIREMERRKLFIEQGHSSLYNYLVKEFGYSEHEAFTRIEASRLIGKFPEYADSLRTGDLSLSTVAEARNAIRMEENRKGTKIDSDTQKSVVELVRGCSRREAQRKLADRFSNFKPGHQERIVNTRDGGWILELFFNQEQRSRIERARDLIAHSVPHAGYSGLIAKLAEHFVKQRDLTRSFAPGGEALHHEKSMPTPSGRISLAMRRAIFRRDKGQCQFRNPDGSICANTYQIELDHIVPVSAGGKNTFDNLRCLCRAHNQWKGDKIIPVLQ